MLVTPTVIPEVVVLEPKIFSDERGFFFESYNEKEFFDQLDLKPDFVQDNHSRSLKHVVRGLHYQIKQPQGKLVRVVEGEVFDVAVDLRKDSSTFGQWVGEFLSAENKKQVWIPEGFAHGFVVLSARADFLYKATNYYAPEHERCIRWDDVDIGIKWPEKIMPVLSRKDAEGVSFSMAEVFS